MLRLLVIPLLLNCIVWEVYLLKLFGCFRVILSQRILKILYPSLPKLSALKNLWLRTCNKMIRALLIIRIWRVRNAIR